MRSSPSPCLRLGVRAARSHNFLLRQSHLSDDDSRAVSASHTARFTLCRFPACATDKSAHDSGSSHHKSRCCFWFAGHNSSDSFSWFTCRHQNIPIYIFSCLVVAFIHARFLVFLPERYLPGHRYSVIAVPQKNDQHFPQSSEQSSYKKSQRTIAPTTPRTVVTLMIISSEII